jgi:hypothetical protein
VAHNPNLVAVVGWSSRQRNIATNETPPFPPSVSQQPGEPHPRIKFVWPYTPPPPPTPAPCFGQINVGEVSMVAS